MGGQEQGQPRWIQESDEEGVCWKCENTCKREAGRVEGREQSWPGAAIVGCGVPLLLLPAFSSALLGRLV